MFEQTSDMHDKDEIVIDGLTQKELQVSLGLVWWGCGVHWDGIYLVYPWSEFSNVPLTLTKLVILSKLSKTFKIYVNKHIDYPKLIILSDDTVLLNCHLLRLSIWLMGI